MNNNTNNHNKDESITLGLLQAIDEKSDINQRHLAKRLGVALGLANSYIKRCINKGLIKIQQAPANRYVYYLTPKGFAEKSRITTQYLSSSLQFYRQSCTSCERELLVCRENGWERIILCGVSELSEIATYVADKHKMQIIGTYDPNTDEVTHLDKPVWAKHEQIEPYDAAILTDLIAPFATYKSIVSVLPKERVLVPDILGLSL